MTPDGRDGGYVRDATTLWRRTLDGAVLLPAGTDDVLHLRGSAATIWALLAEPTTLDELVREVAEVYASSPEDIGGDVAEVLALLVNTGSVGVRRASQ